MFWNYIKIAQRNLLKRKAFSFINVIGLSVSIAVSILILLYVLNELSFDKYLNNINNKYRVISHAVHGGEEFTHYSSNGMLAENIKEQIPGVKNVFQAYVEFPYVQNEDNYFLEDGDDVYYAGEGIIDFLSINLVQGDSETALKEPFSLILTETYAKKYFGSTQVLGKSLLINSKFEYKITGVVKDLPYNTHFKFNILLSLPSMLRTYGVNDFHPFRNSFITYVEFDENVDIRIAEEKISHISFSYIPQELKEIFKVWNTLQLVKDIHLRSEFEDRFKGGNIKTIYIFSSIALLILILACINYINLSTAQYSTRTKEVAIRKTSGATKRDLIRQFITESLIITLVSLATAVVISEFFLPIFNSFIGFDLKISYFENWYNLLLIICIGLVVGVLSSAYPAFFLSSFKVVDVFRMKIGVGHGNINIRRVLVIFQFTVTIFLIISSLVIFKQLKFVSDKDLGFGKNELIAFRLNNSKAREQVDVIKNELNQLPFVKSSSVCSNYPSGDASWENSFEFEDRENEEFNVMPLLDVDYDFIEIMGLNVLDGRNFSKEFGSDSLAVLINKSLANLLGWQDPIGKQIVERVEDKVYNYHVIGVFNDYHRESLHSPIKPMLIRLAERKRFVMVRLHEDYNEQSIDAIKNIWTKFSPNEPFQNKFIDEEFDKLYKAERNLSSIFIYFSIIAIVIACLGLLGLIMFFAQQKTKEISIRKILGASAKNITIILTKEFVLLQIISNLIAIPITYFVMSKWLTGFTYHTSMSWWVFVLGIFITVIVSVAVIGIHTIKAAKANPAENLRYE